MIFLPLVDRAQTRLSLFVRRSYSPEKEATYNPAAEEKEGRTIKILFKMPAVAAAGHKTSAGGSRLARRREIINFNWFQIKAQLLLLLGIPPKCVCGGT